MVLKENLDLKVIASRLEMTMVTTESSPGQGGQIFHSQSVASLVSFTIQ